jgi:hypothetical protein
LPPDAGRSCPACAAKAQTGLTVRRPDPPSFSLPELDTVDESDLPPRRRPRKKIRSILKEVLAVTLCVVIVMLVALGFFFCWVYCH